MTHADRDLRLLPRTGADGKPCYLVTDGTGYLSRRADTAEHTQRAMADELLGHAADLLADRRVTEASSASCSRAGASR
ncbi:hypothetical protein ABZS79_15330 [Streptomyces griseoloalbus]|uniref:hypothetical protein n=1 Tax=Streptomyces griseoloalbus TaxID=67303 RepID=UPI0033B72F7A